MGYYDGVYIDESSFNAQMQYIAEKTATVEYEDIQRRFQSHIQTIRTLYNKYQTLTSYSNSMQTIFQNRYRYSALKENLKDTGLVPQEALVLVYQDQKNENQERLMLTNFLNSLRSWSIDSYREIMDFRTLITGGQELVYDIQQADSRLQTSYRLNEEQYLKLISSDLMTRNRDTDWHTIVNVNKNPDAFIAELRLKIGNPSEWQEKAIIAKTHDYLYKYLYENHSSENNKQDGLAPSRLYELYDQIRYSMFKVGDHSSSISLEEFNSHKTKVKNFIANYLTNDIEKKQTSSSKDNIRFYQTGDSIENNLTLIENKYGTQANIQIKTIKNAINSLYKYLDRTNSKNEIIKELQDLYTYEGKSDFEKSMYKSTAAIAKKGIKEYFNQFSNAEIKTLLT